MPLTALLATAGAHAHAVPAEVTYLFLAVLIGMILSLALEEKIHAKKSMITGAFALISLLLGAVFGLLPFGPLTNSAGEGVALPVYIPAIDWGVITIILGSSLFVDATSKSGLFTYIALRLTRASGGDPWRLLVAYGLMTVIFSAVLNNVTAMIIVGSLTGVSLRKLGREEKLLGFLLVEGLLTNIGGLLTLISSVPNILVGNAAGISFVRFFVVAAPYVVVATALTLWLGKRRFGIERLDGAQAVAEARAQVDSFDPRAGVESEPYFWFSGALLGLFVVVLAGTSAIPYLKDLGMGFVAMMFGLVALARYKATVEEFFSAVDWDLLFFFAFLFIIIHTMEHAQVLALIGEGLKRLIDLGALAGSGALLVAAAGFSSVTDNIPLAAMLSKSLKNLNTPGDSPMWWAVVFGANLGGNLTPIGSASTLVAFTIIGKNQLGLSFGGFVRAALPFAIMQIVLAIVYVLIYAQITG